MGGGDTEDSHQVSTAGQTLGIGIAVFLGEEEVAQAVPEALVLLGRTLGCRSTRRPFDHADMILGDPAGAQALHGPLSLRPVIEQGRDGFPCATGHRIFIVIGPLELPF